MDQLHILGAGGLDNVDHRSIMEIEDGLVVRREHTMAIKTTRKPSAKCLDCGERQGHTRYCVRGADSDVQMLAGMIEHFSWESDESDN
ncbi:hypothetical protein LCGC14_2721440 [marine sediment metagenome]|uniref:Uncharacterized protein n=1 Tax=marine sediment metagenome TaxID=412755 RepID=A0A0F9BJ34_9ZZZZ